jgi:hypothetical protein
MASHPGTILIKYCKYFCFLIKFAILYQEARIHGQNTRAGADLSLSEK